MALEPPNQDRSLATAELLAVGAELLVGDTRDTNSGDVAASLTELGVEVKRISQLPDDLGVVTDAIRTALGRVDLVVTTGGLGPTPDDLTREAIAAATGTTPTVDAELEAWLRELWSARGLPFSESNLKQAWLIPGATALPNPHGTAPGWWVAFGEQVVIALPGPPRELRPMWQEQALPRLAARGMGVDRAATTLHLTAIGESALADVIGGDLLRGDNPRIATYAKADSVDLRISAVSADGRTASQIVEAALAALQERVHDYVFARDANGWVEALTDRLHGRELATIEVGTSGYLGMLLGAAPWLVRAEQRRAATWAEVTAASLAQRLANDSGAAAVIAAVALEAGTDMRVEIALVIDGRLSTADVSVFRGGDAGRRRAANAAIAELWRTLGA